MRIAHVITRMIVGGAQENTLFTCRDLIDEHGDEVLLLTGPALGPEGDLLAQQGRGVPVVELPALRRAIHPWRDWSAYRALRRELVRFRPDVVHTHSAKGGFLGRLAASSLRVPVVVHTVHGAPFHPYQHAVVRELYRRLERHAAKKCHKLVSVADAMTELMIAGDVAKREKFVTIYSGMDVEPLLSAEQHRESARRELGLEPEDVVVGKIARLFHLKGHEYLIRAAESAVRQAPRLKFLLVGDGLLRAELESEIARAGLAGHFRFTGLVPPGEIPKWLGAMDILAHVSLREGLARALPQALIAGRPAISFDIDGAREVVIPDKTGVLLAPGDVEGLAEAFVRLGQSPEIRRQWGEEGRQRFTEQFRHRTMTRQLRELYTALLEEQGRAGRPTPANPSSA
ncbi:MAG: glycosyltransferase family 4 protein [Planctomycetales bacterium]|nr:glycosyltransferase family 4 protein [Planctomycetales bacterium]